MYNDANVHVSCEVTLTSTTLGMINYVHTLVVLLATKANISSCPGALMLRMVPSILLKSPQNSALTTRSASMGKTAEDGGITHQINGVNLLLIYCLLHLIRADSE